MWCIDCERIDDLYFERTTLWLYFPTEDAFAKVAQLCGQNGYYAMPESAHSIAVTLDKPQIDKFLTQVYGSIKPQELAHSRVVTTSEGHRPEALDFGKVMSLDVFINRHKGGWIIDAIDNDRFESWYQPIVHASSTKDNIKSFAHEALFRVYDAQGSMIPPAMVFGLAEQSNLLFSVDLVARRSAVECAAKSQLNGKLFINFNPSSIYDPSYCLRTTAAAIAEIGYKPQDIVFEITETHRATDMAHLKGILAFYRNAGFGVALDDIGSGWSGLNMLNEVQPDYVKIDMDLVRNIHQDSLKQTIVDHLIQIARQAGIKVIAEGIEEPEEADMVRQLGADYLQGYLFGKPQRRAPSVSGSQQDTISSSLSPLKKAARQ